MRDENTGYLQMIKQIEELYERANEETNGFKWDLSSFQTLRDFDRLIENMPPEAWIQ